MYIYINELFDNVFNGLFYIKNNNYYIIKYYTLV